MKFLKGNVKEMWKFLLATRAFFHSQVYSGALEKILSKIQHDGIGYEYCQCLRTVYKR
jgi:Mn-containing catalase